MDLTFHFRCAMYLVFTEFPLIQLCHWKMTEDDQDHTELDAHLCAWKFAAVWEHIEAFAISEMQNLTRFVKRLHHGTCSSVLLPAKRARPYHIHPWQPQSVSNIYAHDDPLPAQKWLNLLCRRPSTWTDHWQNAHLLIHIFANMMSNRTNDIVDSSRWERVLWLE